MEGATRVQQCLSVNYYTNIGTHPYIYHIHCWWQIHFCEMPSSLRVPFIVLCDYTYKHHIVVNRCYRKKLLQPFTTLEFSLRSLIATVWSLWLFCTYKCLHISTHKQCINELSTALSRGTSSSLPIIPETLRISVHSSQDSNVTAPQ